MKRILAGLVVVAFLVVGCAMGLVALRPDQDIQKNTAILLKALDKCKPDAQGWRILEIPDKNFEENHTKFLAYKHSMNSSWGVGVTDGEQTIVLTYNSVQDCWFFGVWGSAIPITLEEADELLRDWFTFIFQDADLSKIRQYQPPKDPGTAV